MPPVVLSRGPQRHCNGDQPSFPNGATRHDCRCLRERLRAPPCRGRGPPQRAALEGCRACCGSAPQDIPWRHLGALFRPPKQVNADLLFALHGAVDQEIVREIEALQDELAQLRQKGRRADPGDACGGGSGPCAAESTAAGGRLMVSAAGFRAWLDGAARRRARLPHRRSRGRQRPYYRATGAGAQRPPRRHCRGAAKGPREAPAGALAG
jgi:hypothetical protein